MPRNLLNVGLTGRNLLNTGDGVTDVVGGDAISVVETDNQIHTVNLDISKQSAVGGAFADTDLFVLETAGGDIKKITGANMKTGTESSNWTYTGDDLFPVAGNATNVVVGGNNTDNSDERKLLLIGDADSRAGSAGTLEVRGISHFKGDGVTQGYLNVYDTDNSHHVTILPPTNASANATLPSTTGTLAITSEIFWEKALGAIRPKTQSDKLQLFSSIRNDSSAQSSFLDLLTFKNTTTSSALATFKYQINDTSTNTTSNAKFKMVHYDDNTDTTTDIYSIDTASIVTISKRLTLTNGLKQGSYDYTMPSASGTLALQSELDDIWTRSSTNIQQTNTNDTLTLDYQADATYKDTLLIKNTNSGTDILTYKYQIKDNGSLDAKLNFKVDYDRGGGTSIDIFHATYDGFLQIKKRLDVANGFYANSGEEYNFPATGGTIVLETLTQNLSNKTFTDATLFEQGLYTKYDGNTTTSGFVRFFEATGQGTNRIDLHVEGHSLASDLNMFLPNSKDNTVLVGRDTTDTLENKTLKLPKILDITGDDSYIFAVSALAADRTITLPLLTGNDTFVFQDHAQNLSNKTLKLPKIFDTSDNNWYGFDVSELTANRTIKLPLLTGNDTFVFKDHAETLSNKTITSFTGNSSASITTPSTSGTLALQSELDDLWNESGPPSARVLATTNSNVAFVTIDNNACIANKLNTNQQIKFTEGSSGTDKISIKTTQLEVDGKIMYEYNNNYYILVSNGIFQITMETFKIPQDMYLQNTSNPLQYIQFKNDLLKIEYSQANVKNGFQIKNSSYTSTTSLGFLDEELIIDFETVSLRGEPKFGAFEDMTATGDWMKFTTGKTRFNSYEVEMCNESSLTTGDAMIAFKRSGDYLYMNCPAHTSTSGTIDEEAIISYHKNGSVIFFNTSSDYLDGDTNYFSFAKRNDQEARISMDGLGRISDEWIDNDDPSDRRLKYDIKDYGNATEVINKIKIKSFMKYRVKNFNNDKDGNMLPFKERLGEARYSIGVIAQELFEIPELSFMVRRSDFNDIEPAYIHDWRPIISLLVKSNQEQQEEKNEMKKEIETLKSEMAELKALVNNLISSQSK